MFSTAFHDFNYFTQFNKTETLEEEKVTKIEGDTFYSHKSEQVVQHTQNALRKS